MEEQRPSLPYCQIGPMSSRQSTSPRSRCKRLARNQKRATRAKTCPKRLSGSRPTILEISPTDSRHQIDIARLWISVASARFHSRVWASEYCPRGTAIRSIFTFRRGSEPVLSIECQPLVQSAIRVSVISGETQIHISIRHLCMQHLESVSGDAIGPPSNRAECYC